MARYVWSREAHAWIEFDPTAQRARPVAPIVIADIEPYREVFTGSRIGSRRHHRDFMRAHKLVEVGNEFNKGLPIDQAPDSQGMSQSARRDAIERAFSQVQQGGARKVAGTEGELDG
jgi:hypothetical protein